MALTQHSIPSVTRNDPRFTLHYAPWVYAVLRLLPGAIKNSGVEVNDEEVRIRMRPGAEVHIPRDSVTRVWRSRGAEHRLVGWLPATPGLHGNLRDVLWLGSGDNLVAIDIDPAASGRIWGISVKPTRVVVSLENPEAFIAEMLG